MTSLKKSMPFVVVVAFVLIEFKRITGQPTYNYHVCSSSSNDTTNSTFSFNLASLLDSLSFEAFLNYSFYKNGSSGIFGLFLCQEAIIWYNECMLHYSDADFFGVMVTYPRVFMWNVQNNTSPNEPDVNASALVYNLVANVPYTITMYGVLESDRGDGSQQRYGLVQCSRDIKFDSRQRLVWLGDEEDIKQCYEGKRGWRILSPSYNLRYEDYLFY
ncbi:hypothetical protein NL676_012856 [Syzygium grande]|nr:hypothetical protein NL676_012856 [Syzygium grande]